MIVINFNNIEETILQNKDLENLLPVDYSSYFYQWRMGQQFPFLNSISKSASLDLLGQLPNCISILENYFKQKVFIETINYNISHSCKVPIDQKEICLILFEIGNNFNYFTTWRDKEHIYISFWR